MKIMMTLKMVKLDACDEYLYDYKFPGILTFTRIYGIPFESFITGGGKDDKKGKKKKQPKPKKGKKGKGKGKQEEAAPNLEKFPEVPEDLAKDARQLRALKKVKDVPDVFVPTTSVGHKEKTTRPPKPFEEGIYQLMA